MSKSLALLDVNVPMYAAGQEHTYKVACAWTMDEIAADRLAAVIDAETIQEILYRYGAIRRWDVAVAMARSLLAIVPTVIPVTDTDLRLAIELFAEYAPLGIATRDLCHAAIMHNNGITTIISTDAHFDRIAGITRLDPHDLYVRQGKGVEPAPGSFPAR